MVEILEALGELGIFIYSFLETLFLVPGIEILSLTLIVKFPSKWITYTIIAIISSVLSASIGFFLGKKYGRPLAIKLTSEKLIKKGDTMFSKHGKLAIFFTASVPTPFSIIVFLSGINKVKFKTFFTITLVGRIIRFFTLHTFILLAADYLYNNKYKGLLIFLGSLLITILGTLLYKIYDIIHTKYNLGGRE